MSKKKYQDDGSKAFKGWELSLLALALLLLFGSATFYVSGFSLRRYIFGMQEEVDVEPVGKMGTRNGGVRRQRFNESEFRTVESDEQLYNFDTLVTGPDGSAVVQLDGGAAIELGPNTMIKLAFESNLTLSGLNRAATVEVVTGNVSGSAGADTAPKLVLRTRDRVIDVTRGAPMQKLNVPLAAITKPGARSAPIPVPAPKAAPVLAIAPAPSPSPSPIPVIAAAPSVKTEVVMVSPKQAEKVTVDPLSQKPEKKLKLQWTVKPANLVTYVVVRSVADKNELLGETVKPDRRGQVSIDLTLDKPGIYEWEILRDENEPFGDELVKSSTTRARFALLPEYIGIETLPPLVGGQSNVSNVYRGEHLNKFDITLRWKSYPDAEGYKVRILDSATSKKALLEKTVKAESYTFNKNKVVSKKIFFAVQTKVGNGFLAVSEPQPFAFNFLPPILVMPEHKAVMSRATLSNSDNGVLLTWQKTNFTEGYEIELASDPEFKKVLTVKRVKENFFVLKAPPVSAYWWRVRSFRKEVSSGFARPYLFTVSP